MGVEWYPHLELTIHKTVYYHLNGAYFNCSWKYFSLLTQNFQCALIKPKLIHLHMLQMIQNICIKFPM